MKINASSFVRVALALVVLVPAARAGDWYVDAQNGSDGNSGSSPSSAWRSITWAVYHTPIGNAETIHFAPGAYLPTQSVIVYPKWKLVGDQGTAATSIVLTGSQEIEFVSIQSGYPNHYGPDTELRGFTIQSTGGGIQLSSSYGEMSPTLSDLVINGAHTGIWFNMSSFENVDSHPTFDHVRVANCFTAILVSAYTTGAMDLTLLDCVLADCSNSGLYVSGRNSHIDAHRCVLQSNTGSGVLFSGSGSPLVGLFEDCLIARNGQSGLRATSDFGSSFVLTQFTLRRSTIALNGAFGVDALETSVLHPTATLESSIIFGNGDDLNYSTGTSASYSDIGDGDFAGSNGNFAADPLFVDGSTGDFRVKWGSPCTETGDPATPLGVLDLAHNARNIDGDLDTLEKPDVGAYEFAPLFLKTSATLGSQVRLELWGPQGNATTVYFARKPIVGPQATPFGELDLDTTFMSVFKQTSVGSGPPKSIVRVIPNNLGYLGLTFSFQALTDSSAAPQGKAYTNAVQFTILP